MQVKDIPDLPILEFLAGLDGRCAIIGGDNDTNILMTLPDVPVKLARAKLGNLIRRGLVDGCACGCRGDFSLTNKGKAAVARSHATTSDVRADTDVERKGSIEDWKRAFDTLPDLIGPAGMIGLADVRQDMDPLANSVALLATALGRGLLSARAAARHLGLTLDEVADLCEDSIRA